MESALFLICCLKYSPDVQVYQSLSGKQSDPLAPCSGTVLGSYKLIHYIQNLVLQSDLVLQYS